MGANAKLKNSCFYHDSNNCTHCSVRIDSIFVDLTADYLEKLNEHKITNLYKKGQIVLHEDNPCPGVFCIASGSVKLVKYGLEGKETLLKIAKPGDVLGVYEVISQQNSNVTAQAMQDTLICFIDKKFIQMLIMQNNDMALKVIQKMTSDLHDFEDRLDDMQNKDVYQRIIKLLLVLNTTHGVDVASERLLNIKLARSEMAAMVSTTPESVMRTLSELKKLNLIRLDGKKIYLIKIKELEGQVQLIPEE